MKFGVADYGMNVWDGGLYDIRERLARLRAIGFDGIERVEAVSEADALMRAAMYRRLGMDFATCRGPSTQVGIDWTAGLGKDYVWLRPGDTNRDRVSMADFLRRSHKFAECCANAGISCALHNHMGERIQNQDELDQFMAECPECKLLFDTGHLLLAGGDIIGTLKRYAGRLAALHIKDAIRHEDGKTEFCGLGKGNTNFDFDALFAAIRESGFDGWVFIEQDQHTADPYEQLAENYQFMREHNLIQK